MRDPELLFELTAAADEVPPGLPLVAGLTGFADAGSAVTQLNSYLLEALEVVPLAEFDNDALLDYRARRPTIVFDQDHLAEYTPPKLTLSIAHDDVGQSFLLLTGYEPDFQWERFADALFLLMERFAVSSMTWVHAIPMPVPHTRPIQVTVSGTRTDLIESMSVWKPRTQAPANLLHLVEYRMQERGDEVVGFVLLVPHYLADTELPNAAVTALESISASTGLIFPTDRLRTEGREFLTKVDEQVTGNDELRRLVGTLEQRHDTYMEGMTLQSPLTDEDGVIPSADEIAAELEKFLATRRRRDDEQA
ncbi:proteasome assembly chaperone family protein [Naasia lichenicola]|uniref:PAC2 family protein n=1 Tax=Naasia lichenicola TaxID=2565933 RepID=A0A4S4FQU2_9MICO|nr:PAC2 family protein [Naasia lichenicola]THG32950.1 PAC2 family protein [Naasia lichenicola]